MGNSDAGDAANATTSLLPPADLAATPVSDTENDLSWTNPSQAATGFTIQRRTGSNSFTTIGTVSGGTNTTFQDQTAVPGIPYDYQVTATVGSASAAAGTSTQTLPANLSGLTATSNSASSATLSWTPVTGADGYEIDRKDASGNWEIYDSVDDGSASGYTDSGVQDGTTYTYRVLPYNDSGTSDESTAQTKSATTLLIQPANVKAVALSSGSVEIVWDNQSSSETGFQVQRLINGAVDNTFIAVVVSAGTTQYINTTAQPGLQYTYGVSAINSTGSSSPSVSNLVTVRPQLGLITTPTLTATISGTPVGSGLDYWSNVQFSYSYSPGDDLTLEEIAPGFSNYQDLPSSVAGNLAASAGTTIAEVMGDTYTFRLRADLNGEVAYSQPVTITTPSQPSGSSVLPAPTVVSVEPDPENPGYLDVVAADDDPNILVAAAVLAGNNPYQVQPLEGGASRGSDGDYDLTLPCYPYEGPGTLELEAYNVSGASTSPIVTQPVTIPGSPGAFAETPTLSITPAGNGSGDLVLSWSGALTQQDAGNPETWLNTRVYFGYPDGHTPDWVIPRDEVADYYNVISTTVNPDGTGDEVIDPTQPSIDGLGNYVFVIDQPGYTSQPLQISPSLTPPAAPTLEAVVPYDDSTGAGLRLLWNDNSPNETGFAIQRSTSSNFSANLVTFNVGADVENYDDTSAAVGQTYYYRVQATNGAGASAYYTNYNAAVLTLPTVSVSALDPNATFAGPDGNPQDGYLDFHRTGDLTAALTAGVSYAGTTAVAGQDIAAAPPTTVTFAAGQLDVVIPVTPANAAIGAGSNVIAQVSSGTGYQPAEGCAEINLAAHGLVIQLVNGPTGGGYTDAYGDDELLDTGDPQGDLQQLLLTLPSNAANGATFTLSIVPKPDTNTADLVDVWTAPQLGDGATTPLLGSGLASYTWTVGSSTGSPPTTLSVSGIAGSVAPGDLVFSISETDANAVADPTTKRATVLGRPSAPQNFTSFYDMTASPGTIHLSWKKSASGQVASYDILRVSSLGERSVGSVPASTTTYIDTPPDNGPYTYYIYALNSAHLLSTSYATTSCQAIGGPDVTKNLLAIRRAVMALASTPAGLAQLNKFWDDTWANQLKNWDIFSLHTNRVTLPYDVGVLPDGTPTVTVNGDVYKQYQVNYWLYGVWAAAVGASPTLAKIKIFGHKIFTGDVLDEQAWFSAGYSGAFADATTAALQGVLPSPFTWPTTLSWKIGVGSKTILGSN